VIYWLYVGRPTETDHDIWPAADRFNIIVNGLILSLGFNRLTSRTAYLKKSGVTFYNYYYYYINEQTGTPVSHMTTECGRKNKHVILIPKAVSLPVLQGVMFSTYGVIKYLEVTLIALVFVT
jgi:hypothetical protein